MHRSSFPWGFATACALFIVGPAVCELGLSLPLGNRFYPGYIVAMAVLLTPYLIGRWSRVGLGLMLTSMALVVAIWLAPWTPRKRFEIAARHVKLGMAKSDVDAALSGFGKQVVSAPGASPEKVEYRIPNCPRFARDRAIVIYSNGTVEAVSYRRD